MGRPNKFSPEVHERAVRMIFDQPEDNPSELAAIASMAEIGCGTDALPRWSLRHSGSR